MRKLKFAKWPNGSTLSGAALDSFVRGNVDGGAARGKSFVRVRLQRVDINHGLDTLRLLQRMVSERLVMRRRWMDSTTEAQHHLRDISSKFRPTLHPF